MDRYGAPVDPRDDQQVLDEPLETACLTTGADEQLLGSGLLRGQFGRFTVSREPMIEVSGLRNSWLTVETKSVFICATSSRRRVISAWAS